MPQIIAVLLVYEDAHYAAYFILSDYHDTEKIIQLNKNSTSKH